MANFHFTAVEPGFEKHYLEMTRSSTPSKAAEKAADSGQGWGTYEIQASTKAEAIERAKRRYPNHFIDPESIKKF